MPSPESITSSRYLERRLEAIELATGQSAPGWGGALATPSALLTFLNTQTIGTAGSTTITPASNTNIFTGVSLSISGGTNNNSETVVVSARTGTTFTAPFADAHAGTCNASYLVNATSATAITGSSTTSITLDNVTNVVVGQTLFLKGTGADAAKTDTWIVLTVNAGSKVITTSVAPTNSYSSTVLIGAVAPTTSATSITSGLTTQVTVASATGLVAGMVVGLHGAVADIALVETKTILQVVSTVVTFTAPVSSAFSTTFGVIQPVTTTFPTVVGSRQSSIAHGLSYTPEIYGIVPTSAGQIFQYQAADATNVYLQADIVGRTCNIAVGR